VGSKAPKNPVNSVGVKAQGTEALLEIGNIVASKHGGEMFKWSTPEHMAGLNEDRPRGSIDQSSDGKSSTPLKGFNSRLRCWSEHS
jgi:hypothetical protein